MCNSNLRTNLFLALGFSMRHDFQLLLRTRPVLALGLTTRGSCQILLRNLPSSVSKTHFQSRSEDSRHQISRERFVERLQNKMIVEQPHQRLPLIRGERTFGPHVCQWFCGAHVGNGNRTDQIHPFKSQIQVDAVSS